MSKSIDFGGNVNGKFFFHRFSAAAFSTPAIWVSRSRCKSMQGTQPVNHEFVVGPSLGGHVAASVHGHGRNAGDLGVG